MKIIVTGIRGFPNVQGGIESHCEHLYPALVQKGCDVTVITRRPYIDPSVTSYQGVKLATLDCPHNKFLEAWVHTFKGVLLARKMGCDILHIHAVGPSFFVPMARLLGLKVVMTSHGPDYKRKKWNAWARLILKMGEWNGCIFSNEVIAVSQRIAGHIERRYGRKVNQIPNGVMLSQRVGTDGALKQFGLEKGKYILAVGRFVPEKGFHDLMDAFRGGNGLNSLGYKLVIVGDADHTDEYSITLKSKAKQIKGVVLTGRLTGLPLKELYSHAGLFVLPSYYEGLPIVLLEALSYGLSCVVSDIPSNREVDLDNEWFFRPGDLVALSRKLMSIRDRSLTAEEQVSQIKIISEKYNWKTISEKTFKVYQKVMGRDKSPSVL